MKTTKAILTTLCFGVAIGSTSTSMAEDSLFKKYEIKSAKIIYNIKGSGNIMNMVKTKTIGKKRLVFNNFGAHELTEKSKITKKLQGGKTTKDKTHTLTLMRNGISYKVNFKTKEIMRHTQSGGMNALFGAQRKSTAETMKSLGGKKLGTETVVGIECTVWDLMGSKQCIYKGIPLKIETNLMSVKSVEIATKAEFNISVTEDDLQLPDYPIFNFDMDAIMQGQKPALLDKSKLAEMDAADNRAITKDAEDAQEMIKIMAQASAQAGMKKGQKPSEDQQEAMMQNMGNIMFPRIKKKMLEQVEMMEFGADCLGSADTLKEANACGKKAATKFPSADKEMHFDAWNPNIKKEVMTEITHGLGMAECMKAANNMGDLQKCDK